MVSERSCSSAANWISKRGEVGFSRKIPLPSLGFWRRCGVSGPSELIGGGLAAAAMFGCRSGVTEVVAEEPFFRGKIPPFHPDPCIIGGAEALAAATAAVGLTSTSQVSPLSVA